MPMSPRTTIRLLAAAILLGLAVWLTQRTAPPAARHGDRLIPMNADDVVTFAIEREADSFRCINRDGIWRMTQPFEGRADAGEVARLLAVWETVRIADRITPEERQLRQLLPSHYGLDQPVVTLTVRDRQGNARTLHLGARAPQGNTVYVMEADSQDILTTSGDLLSAVPEKAEALRDKRLFTGSPALVTRIELRRPDGTFIQMARSGRQWIMQQPTRVNTRASAARIVELLDRVFSLRAEAFTWDAPLATNTPILTPENPLTVYQPYGLTPDEAIVRVAIWQENDKTGTELLLGKPVTENPDRVYARLATVASVYEVNTNILAALQPAVGEWRSRVLFGWKPEDITAITLESPSRKLAFTRSDVSGWQLSQPLQWKADRQMVTALLDQLLTLRYDEFADAGQTNLEPLGLASPALVIHLESATAASPLTPTEGPAAATRTPLNRLLIGTSTTDGATYARFEADPVEAGERGFIYRLTNTVNALFPPEAMAPITYYDHTMLAIPPNTIRRITLRRAGAEQTIRRETGDLWVPDMEPAAAAGARVRTAAVDELLFLAAHLRALRIETEHAESPAALGLDPGATTVTFGLSGEEGIQKTLLIGFRARADGRYAMIQGYDVVFVLAESIVEKIEQDLIDLTATPREG